MGKWIYALRIFGDMPIHGCTLDLYTYGTLIHALCGFGMIGESKERYSNCELLCRWENSKAVDGKINTWLYNIYMCSKGISSV